MCSRWRWASGWAWGRGTRTTRSRHLPRHRAHAVQGDADTHAQQIADEIDSVGGDINAFTSKENTCYYARILSEHVPLAVDVLTDMFLNSLDPEEMGRELNVILEEIKRRDDEPDDLVHDLFTETLWPGHVLGKSVIGTPRDRRRPQAAESARLHGPALHPGHHCDRRRRQPQPR